MPEALKKFLTRKFQKPCLGYFNCYCITPLPQACSRKTAVSLHVFPTTRANKLRLPMENNSQTQLSPQLTTRGHCERCPVINTPGKGDLVLTGQQQLFPCTATGERFLKNQGRCLQGYLLHWDAFASQDQDKLLCATFSSLPDSLGIMFTAPSCFFASRPP